MDSDIPEHEKYIAKDSREYGIYLDSKELANYILLYEKYETKEDKNKWGIDILYETIMGGYFDYTDGEKNIIKKKALKIVKTVHQRQSKLQYKILKSLIKDNNKTYTELSNSLNVSLLEFEDIISGKKELSYKNALLLSSFFGLTPDDVFYSEFKNFYLNKKK